MADWLGDYPEDHTTVTCMFTTHQASGAAVAPLSAFEAGDIIIYKNGSGTQKTSTNGITMTSPFDSIVGLHCIVIDTSNDTGDSGFWVHNAVYTIVLSPDTETVDGTAVTRVIAQFGIELYGAVRPTTLQRRLDVSAGGEAGIDWANIGSPTTAQNLSATNIDVDQIVASVSGAVGSVTGAVGSVTGNVGGTINGLTAVALKDFFDTDSTTTFASAVSGSVVKEIADNAGGGTAPTADQNADALLDRVDAIETGLTVRQAMRLSAAADGGKVSGGATTTNTFRNAVADDTDRIIATVDADGNRTAITYDLA